MRSQSRDLGNPPPGQSRTSCKHTSFMGISSKAISVALTPSAKLFYCPMSSPCPTWPLPLEQSQCWSTRLCSRLCSCSSTSCVEDLLPPAPCPTLLTRHCKGLQLLSVSWIWRSWTCQGLAAWPSHYSGTEPNSCTYCQRMTYLV